MSTDNLPARNEFYKKPEFIASALVLVVFIFDFLPFFHFMVKLSGLSTLDLLTELSSNVYYIFYLVPVGALYLAIKPFLKEGPATAYAMIGKYVVFGGLTLFFVFKLLGVGEISGGLGGLGVGFYVAWIASWFLPFEEKMLELVQKGRQKAEDAVQQNKGG